jgi:hypothetical protein
MPGWLVHLLWAGGAALPAPQYELVDDDGTDEELIDDNGVDAALVND